MSFFGLLGEHIDFYIADWIDHNVVADTIKLYFKKLPEPLIPSDKYYDFIKVASEWNVIKAGLYQQYR